MKQQNRVTVLGTFNKVSNEAGFSLTELLVVVGIIAVLGAIAVPRLFQTKQGAAEKLAQSSLSSLVNSQETYRTVLAKRTYGSLAQLRITLVNNVPLVPVTLVDSSGNGIATNGWVISQTELPTATTFGLAASPTSDNSPATQQYCVFEDGGVRSSAVGGQCTRTSALIANQ